MTQYPNYGNPSYATPMPSPRPMSVTVVAIVGIVWGVLMLLCNGFGLITVFKPDIFGPNPALNEIRAHPTANLWTNVSPFIGIALAVLLIAGASGALGLRGWGRAAMLMFAFVDLVVAMVNLIVTVTVINPIMARAMQGQIPGNNARVFEMAQHGGAIIGILVVLVMPVWILLVMFRANVKAAFATGGLVGIDPGQAAYGGYAPGGQYPPPGAGVPQQQYPPQYPPQGPYGQQ